MEHTIVIPFEQSADHKKILECCQRHGVKAAQGNIRGQKVYSLTTKDVSNFYYLGLDIQTSLK